MKRFVMLIIACGLFVVFATGCSDVAEGRMESMENGNTALSYSVQAAETAALIEEGYYVVEGILSEINKEGFFLETGDGQTLYFKLAPETIICAGKNKEILSGQNIKVVFDGEQTKSGMEKVDVIAVTLLEK